MNLIDPDGESWAQLKVAEGVWVYQWFDDEQDENGKSKYDDFTSEHLKSPYDDDDFDHHRLEIRWTVVYADKLEIAQLDSGFWYYSKTALGDHEVTAFGLTYIDHVLTEYDLIFPDSFALPLFQPEFVEGP